MIIRFRCQIGMEIFVIMMDNVTSVLLAALFQKIVVTLVLDLGGVSHLYHFNIMNNQKC